MRRVWNFLRIWGRKFLRFISASKKASERILCLGDWETVRTAQFEIVDIAYMENKDFDTLYFVMAHGLDITILTMLPWPIPSKILLHALYRFWGPLTPAVRSTPLTGSPRY